ncbi:hypothetical protein I4641_07080 [Waterburya agarophytonicola K14]|uniref:Uncharacterized protein n=1 Tax=Waterburya agarophytonicola KI4 TaxID=2874699 RepID=A0A964BP80_9CYAN|nr:hypothetical protein [Waterburya agarophytonicola]MCC0176739.1 hypothetical protein [Waterburya agarophytonicola KI4]
MFTEKIELKPLLGMLLLISATSIGVQITVRAENIIIEQNIDSETVLTEIEQNSNSETVLTENISNTKKYLPYSPIMVNKNSKWYAYSGKKANIPNYNLSSEKTFAKSINGSQLTTEFDMFLATYPTLDLSLMSNTNKKHFTFTFLTAQ